MASSCVLTVGSTRFDPLVASFLDPTSLSSLSSLGIQHVLAQVGNSALPGGWKEGARTVETGLQIEVVRFLDDLEDRVGRSDLVVSHAGALERAQDALSRHTDTQSLPRRPSLTGAGSILSFLRPLESSSSPSQPKSRRRQLVLVPNSTLMDSHQSDLADEMEKKGWAVVCRRPEYVAHLSRRSNFYQFRGRLTSWHTGTSVRPCKSSRLKPNGKAKCLCPTIPSWTRDVCSASSTRPSATSDA